MSNELIKNLEVKIDNAIETIELLRLQVEELEEKNNELIAKTSLLQQENSSLTNCNEDWQKNVNNLLNKLDSANVTAAASAKQPEIEVMGE